MDLKSNSLYVIEQNTLRSFSYEPFSGDVLTFCLTGNYDCDKAQNSGECLCRAGYGGPCCDLRLGEGILPNLLTAFLSYATLAPSFIAAIMLLRFGLRRAAAPAPSTPPRSSRRNLGSISADGLDLHAHAPDQLASSDSGDGTPPGRLERFVLRSCTPGAGPARANRPWMPGDPGNA